MATTLTTVDCKLFQMMPYVIILKVRKFHQPTADRFSTTRQKHVERGHNVPILNRVKGNVLLLSGAQKKIAPILRIVIQTGANLAFERVTGIIVYDLFYVWKKKENQ